MARCGRVCVFAKRPRPGVVKTRLSPEVGRLHTPALARAFLRDTWSLISGLPWARPVLATTEHAGEEFGLGVGAEVWLQGPGDLGQRLERVLARALSDTGLAIAIGADTPGLPARFLEQARDALARADAVLGPCEDGGFYLLGLTRCPPGLLRDLPWSDAETFARTLARLRARGMTVLVLEPWFDVDGPADLRRLRTLIERREVSAPETAAALACIGRAPTRSRTARTAAGS